MEALGYPMIGRGAVDKFLDNGQLSAVVDEAIAPGQFDHQRVLVIIPDGTRTMPMPQMFSLFRKHLRHRVKALDFLVALGTHPPMSDEQLSKLIGQPVVDGAVGDTRIFNHRWDDLRTFAPLGTIPAEEIELLTSGRMRQEVPVELNRLILDYDQLVICGPVFPHEVVGFSGGNKYFFPGIGGSAIINFTHWLGAVITSYDVIGAGYTPVRAVIDRAASLVPRPVSCFALVVTHEGTKGIYFGSASEAWKAASELSAKVHIRWIDRPYKRVLSVMPEMYDDLWTAAKGMYKLEPAIADGGEVVIFAPHITEVSFTHGALIDEVGYHCRDYFLKQWSRFQNYPGGVLAHSTHVKGLGTYDAESGVESSRIQVTLATGISEERCRKINLGYIDPSSIDLNQWQGREEEGVLLVPRAGEILYRLKQGDSARAN